METFYQVVFMINKIRKRLPRRWGSLLLVRWIGILEDLLDGLGGFLQAPVDPHIRKKDQVKQVGKAD